MSETKPSDKKQAAASYVFSFYYNVMSLTEWHSQYKNLTLELNFKADEDGYKYLPEEDKQQIKLILLNLRLVANKAYMQYLSLKDKFKLDNKKDMIVSYYNKLNTLYVIDPKDLENFVLEMNKVLVNDIIQDILQSNEDVVNSLYNEN